MSENENGYSRITLDEVESFFLLLLRLLMVMVKGIVGYIAVPRIHK